MEKLLKVLQLNTFTVKCTSDALKVLINCTESGVKVTTTEKSSSNVFIYAFILVVIAVLVILVIIALVIAIHKNLNSGQNIIN